MTDSSPRVPRPPRLRHLRRALRISRRGPNRAYSYSITAGPSQVDLFDPKPELNKRHGQPIPNLDNDPLFKSRNPGLLLGTPSRFQRHGQSGLEISSFFPHLATCADDLAIVRSCYADSFAHGSGLLQMNTGFVRQGISVPRLMGYLRAWIGE